MTNPTKNMKKSTKLQTIQSSLHRIIAVFTAVPIVLVLAGTVITPAVSAIGGQTQSRTITLSDNRISGGATGGTGVSYDVSVNLASSYTMKGLIVDFCAGTNSPIIGTTCTQPASMSLGTPTFTGDTTGGTHVDVSSWTAATANTGRTFVLTNATGIAVTGSSVLHFTITGVTNTVTLGTFYARILTFTTTAAATAYTDTTPGSYQDYGGFALSTANPVTVTARVQETLTYCVSGSDLSGVTGNTCISATSPSFILGHGTGPSTYTIDNSEVDAATAFTQISTNASLGAVVRMKNFNSCTNAGLSSNGGSTCNISGVAGASVPSPSLGSVASAIVAGTTGFGLYVSNGATTSGISTSGGAYAPDANYHNAAHVTEPTQTVVGGALYDSPNPDLYYGDDQDALTGVGTTYGDTVATTGGAPCSQMNNHLVFGVTAGLTVPAGIYTANIDFIATGTF
jgi:hypothetical protein